MAIVLVFVFNLVDYTINRALYIFMDESIILASLYPTYFKWYIAIIQAKHPKLYHALIMLIIQNYSNIL
ncbi:hypothetical protein TI04_04530 [Achromatium sp. WMS2]|nr:hypothetical protein TI04_04530 [Achromatium sp. WMS2]